MTPQTRITGTFGDDFDERLERARDIRERARTLIRRWDDLSGEGWTTPPPVVDETACYADHVLDDPQHEQADQWLDCAEQTLETAISVIDWSETAFEADDF